MPERLANRLKEKRGELGLTQAELAERCGVTRKTVNTVENGVFVPSALPVPGGPITWSSEGPSPSPYLRTQGLVSARCVNEGQRGYLSVRTNADPADKRTDRVGGEVGALGFFLPGWGMHMSDIVAAQGDIVRAIERVSRR
jgi:hypothetical protein